MLYQLVSIIIISDEGSNEDYNLFSMLGYYSYTVVNKNRYTYQLKDNDYTYSIMVVLTLL